MKAASFSHRLLLAFPAVFLFALIFSQCQPCNSCNDPLLIKVPAADPSPPTYQWEMSQAVHHSNGLETSSISMVPAGTATVNSIAADSVTTNIYLRAIDPESGVKCIRISGGFGMTCSEPEGMAALAIDGIITPKENCQGLTACCMKELRMTMEDLGDYIRCPGNRILNNGGIGLNAVITNCKGVSDTVNLTIQF